MKDNGIFRSNLSAKYLKEIWYIWKGPFRATCNCPLSPFYFNMKDNGIFRSNLKK